MQGGISRHMLSLFDSLMLICSERKTPLADWWLMTCADLFKTKNANT
jgi:hypothetical protein